MLKQSPRATLSGFHSRTVNPLIVIVLSIGDKMSYNTIVHDLREERI
jgi:hypothetical protein